MTELLHGRVVRFHNGRYFAVPKPFNRADHIAHLTQLCGNLWQRVMHAPVGAQVIVNQKRADGRRDARMARLTRGSQPRYGRR